MARQRCQACIDAAAAAVSRATNAEFKKAGRGGSRVLLVVVRPGSRSAGIGGGERVDGVDDGVSDMVGSELGGSELDVAAPRRFRRGVTVAS